MPEVRNQKSPLTFDAISSAVMAFDPAGKARMVSSEELSAWFSGRLESLTRDERWLDARALAREFFLKGQSDA